MDVVAQTPPVAPAAGPPTVRVAAGGRPGRPRSPPPWPVALLATAADAFRPAPGSPVSVDTTRLRANADIRPGAGRQARSSCSRDGVTFATLGPALTLDNAWQFFMGYRSDRGRYR